MEYETVETFRRRGEAVDYLRKLRFSLTPSFVFWRRGETKVFIMEIGQGYRVVRMSDR